MTHTPGPWITETLLAPNGAKYYRVYSEHNDDPAKPIAQVFANDLDGSYGAHANARLIAAAPELLEVLCRMVDAMERGYPPTLEDLKLGQAAITKAAGR